MRRAFTLVTGYLNHVPVAKARDSLWCRFRTTGMWHLLGFADGPDSMRRLVARYGSALFLPGVSYSIKLRVGHPLTSAPALPCPATPQASAWGFNLPSSERGTP